MVKPPSGDRRCRSPQVQLVQLVILVDWLLPLGISQFLWPSWMPFAGGWCFVNGQGSTRPYRGLGTAYAAGGHGDQRATDG